MDNLSSHKDSRVRELIEERGCELMYLPPYSPELNPIEEAFAKLKALLWRAGARTREAFIEAMGRALDAVTATPGASSSTAATALRPNCYDRCFRCDSQTASNTIKELNEEGRPLRLVQQSVANDEPDPNAISCFTDSCRSLTTFSKKSPDRIRRVYAYSTGPSK
jgi:hypothetical protein